MQSPSSDATVESLATWNFWPNPPSGDFARLIPDSDLAKEAFQRQVLGVQSRRENPQYADRFMHFEETLPEYAYPTASEPSHSEHETSQTVQECAQRHCLPCVTGFFRLHMADPSPLNVDIGWRIGSGRPNVDVEFVIGERNRGIRGIHARIKRSLTSGAILAISDSHEFWADSTRLQGRMSGRECPLNQRQRALQSDSVVHIKGHAYRLEVQDISRDQDHRQLQRLGKRHSDSHATSDVFLTPTPTQDQSASMIRIGRDWIATPAFSTGASASVFYAAHNVTGEAFAIKKITVPYAEHPYGKLVQNEINMLQACDHRHIVKLKHAFDLALNRPDIIPTDYVGEWHLVLSPPLRRSLHGLMNNSPYFQDQELTKSDLRQKRSHTTLILLYHIADACAYLHSQGIMHRDIKPDNIGVYGDQLSELHFYLLDFGHATSQATSTDHYKGTNRYLAPEVIELRRNPNHWQRTYSRGVDVWSLGITSLELGLGVNVPNVESAFRWAREVRDFEIKKPENVSAEMTAVLRTLQQSMLQEPPKDRITMRSVHDQAGMALSLTR